MADATPLPPCTTTLELADVLRRQIRRGERHPGDRLPTVREMAAGTRLSYNSVSKAVGILANEGLVEAQRGAGSFVRAASSAPPQDAASSHVLALVVPQVQGGFCASMLAGFGEGARQAQKQVVVCDTQNDLHRQTEVLLELLDRRVGGVALMPVGSTATPPHHVRVLQRAGVPVALFRPVGEIAAPLLSVPYEEVGQRAARELARRGHRRIAAIFAGQQPSAARYRGGLERGLAEAGVATPDLRLLGTPHPPWDLPQHAAIVQQVVSLLNVKPRQRPTALFVASDELAEVVHLGLAEAGVRVPEDLSLLSFGDAFREGPHLRRTSAITVDQREIGRLAAVILTEMGSGARRVAEAAVAPNPVAFHEGATLGAVE